MRGNSLIGNVTMDVQHTCLHCDTFVVSERGHGGSITETNDASCYSMMEKTNCSRGGASSEAHYLTIRATIIGVSGVRVGQNKAGYGG